MKLKNQKGSVLLVVMVAAAVFLFIIGNLASRFSNLAGQAKQFAVSKENQRVGDELAKLVSKAYERGAQIAAGGGTCPGPTMTDGATTLCFGETGPPNKNCVDTLFRADEVCINTGTSVLVGQNERANRYQFVAEWRRRSTPSWTQWILPSAHAQVDPALPAEPTWTANTAVALTCDGVGDPAICRSCGAGQNFICFELQFCPVDKTTCAAIERVRMGFMVARGS